MTEELKQLFFAYLHGYADGAFSSRVLGEPEPLLPVHFRQTCFFRRYVKGGWDEELGQTWLKEWIQQRKSK